MNDPIESRTIFCFWTGTNPMSESRRRCYESLYGTSGCNVVLITPENLYEYIVPEHPLHEAYTYLSETHKADYLRTYFMHFYGGGYSDIKVPSGNWLPAFEDLIDNPSMLLNGYHEVSPESVGGDKTVQSYWNVLVGNCAYIVRPKTPFTELWYTTMLIFLDSKLVVLRLNPSTDPQCCSEHATNKYPIGWNEMLGRIFHKLSCAYTDRFLYTVPHPICHSYR